MSSRCHCNPGQPVLHDTSERRRHLQQCDNSNGTNQSYAAEPPRSKYRDQPTKKSEDHYICKQGKASFGEDGSRRIDAACVGRGIPYTSSRHILEGSYEYSCKVVANHDHHSSVSVLVKGSPWLALCLEMASHLQHEGNFGSSKHWPKQDVRDVEVLRRSRVNRLLMHGHGGYSRLEFAACEMIVRSTDVWRCLGGSLRRKAPSMRSRVPAKHELCISLHLGSYESYRTEANSERSVELL